MSTNSLNETELTLPDFDYALDPELIAQSPSESRDGAKLLVRSPSGQFKHRMISDLINEVPMNSLIIVNDSRVIASRLIGRLETGARIEIFLMEPTGAGTEFQSTWKTLGKPVRKLKSGTKVFFDHELVGTVIGEPDRTFEPPALTVDFNRSPPDFLQWLEKYGQTPLPPYISRANATADQTENDRIRYQTVFANEQGSVAAPTAGLHYTPDLMARLSNTRGVTFARVTLHVGAGTFLPVKSDDLSQHQMHTERFMISSGTLDTIVEAKAAGRPIIAVGTTTLRTLESFWEIANRSNEGARDKVGRWHKTSLFIRPKNINSSKYKPWCATALQTNFHQPKSTLLMLVSALIGVNEVRALYSEAIKERYRFFSYGDSTLLWL